MAIVDELARFVVRASYADLSDETIDALKIRVLDSLGCAIGALGGEPIGMLRTLTYDFGGRELSTLIGNRKTAPDRAALYNGALVRYLDFNDSYLAKGETCHPSDNLAPVLAAAEYEGQTGKTFLTALAVAYQVHCRLSDEAPVRAKGFDHTTQGGYAAAAGMARGLGLDEEGTANAISIAGTALNALRVTRTGALSHWKGLAYPFTSFGAVQSAFLAKRGIIGPKEVFEGNKGFMDSIAGTFEIDWSKEDLSRVTKTILKKYNAEIHSQAAIEGILELKEEHDFSPGEVEAIHLEIFDVAYHIIGGGEEGEKMTVRTKEEADHSLPYLLAAALLDGNVLPEQYEPERIARKDVQSLLKKVTVRPADDLSERFPMEHACRLEVKHRGGKTVSKEKSDYEGFVTRPMSWTRVIEKFNRLTERFTTLDLRGEIVDLVQRLERVQVSQLTQLLGKVGSDIREGLHSRRA